jgi:cytochrome c oxidase assembly factor CtaG
MNRRLTLTVPLIAMLCMAGMPAVARADGVRYLSPGNLATAWNFDPLIVLNLVLASSLYALGLRKLWRRAGVGSGVNAWSGLSFALGMATLVVALLSPLGALSEQLSAAHMVQHMLLMVVAAPLLMAGLPGTVLIWGLPAEWRGAWARGLKSFDVDFLQKPFVPAALFAVTLWVWHLPAAYQAALVDPLVHDAQHLTFFLAGCLFWRVMLIPRRRWPIHSLANVGYLFATSIHATILGVFMSLAPAAWYGVYATTTERWGLSPLEDQQLAGLIMWMPACLVFPAAAAIVFGRWLSQLQTPTEPSWSLREKGA